MHSGLSQRTVSRLLRILRDEPDPLLDLVTRGRMARADRYRSSGSRTPTPTRSAGVVGELAASTGYTRRSWSSAATAGLVHQVLDGTEARGAEVARAARLSPSATSAALRVLAEHGLAERGRGGWRRGAASLDEVASVDRGG